jgi:nicotinate-nucleotide adenylyltransferase
MIGLFFGSFNPIHKGHVSVARAALESSGLAEIWFVVSPMNPFKDDKDLAPAMHRLEMVRGALINEARMKACDVELSLPIPSYTSITLDHLKTLHPNVEFVLLLGWDTFQSMPQWHRAEHVMKYKKIIYPRGNEEVNRSVKITDGLLLDQPLLSVSATDIRRRMIADESCEDELEQQTREYILRNGLYR